MRILPKAQILLASLTTAVLLTACGGDKANYDFSQPLQSTTQATPPHGPVFDPANGKIPSTNDLLFKGSKDGTLNIPNPDNNPVKAAINELDGFSTTIPFTADFGMSLDQASLKVGDSIHIFEVQKQGPAVASAIRELSSAEIAAAATGEEGKTLALVPKIPLKESTAYMVVLTNKIKGKDGKPAQAPAAYTLARSNVPLTGGDFAALEDLRVLINFMEDVAASQDSVAKNEIILSWSFTTQSTTAVLNAVAANAKAGKMLLVPTGKTTHDALPALPGIADIYIGTLDIPYYLETPSASNPRAPRTGHWKGKNGAALTRYNTTPVATQTLTIPVMMTVPNANSGQSMPEGGWPIVIYQHGITRLRTDVLGYADPMAQAGFAVIAIDLPLHGITDPSNPFHAKNTPFPNDVEPTFDIDFLDNTNNALKDGGDGIIDSSGENFINLQSLLTSRDNIRQGVSNLLVLRRSLSSISQMPNIPAINADKVGFIAHSLGGIIGTTYLGVEDKSMPSSLVTTGASISTILRDSAAYGPIIKGALAAQGVTGAAYEQFLYASQWAVDSADPVNFAMDAAATHPLHLIKVNGDGTVPNSSTDILSALVDASKAADPVNPVSIGKPKLVTFTKGNHSSILDPTRGGNFLDVFLEMHSELAKFQASGGTAVVISNTDIVEK